MGVSVRTPEIENEIVERLSKGEPLAVICRDIGIGVSTVYDWRDQDEQFAGSIARAREIGFDQIALDALAIADATENDTVETEDGRKTPNSEWITRSRLRVETRLKLLAKWDPKRYGELIKHSGPDGSSPAVTALTLAFVKTAKPADA